MLDHLKAAMKEKSVCEVLDMSCHINSVSECVYSGQVTVEGMRKSSVLLNLPACFACPGLFIMSSVLCQLERTARKQRFLKNLLYGG